MGTRSNMHDRTAEAAVGLRKGSWLDELMVDAGKTMVVGTGDDKRICGLYMKRGECPHCGKQIERTKDDIYFPYCCYDHKRVLEREEEAKIKAEIAAEEEIERARYARKLEWNNRRRQELRVMSKRGALEAKLKTAMTRYEENTRMAANSPKGSKERHRASARARDWYLNVIKLQRELKIAQERALEQ